MTRNQKVTTGKYYVNNARNIVREVLEVRDEAVVFITYHLDTGASAGIPSECARQHFRHWADHEATQTEITSLQQWKM